MGVNAWEWVETDGVNEKGTRGGSWWYGATQMKANYKPSKPMAQSRMTKKCLLSQLLLIERHLTSRRQPINQYYGFNQRRI